MNPLNEALPTGVVTVTIPEDPLATTAITVVADTIVSELAVVPPKVTEVASVKFVPVIVTVVPFTAVVGVKDVMAGAGKNEKSPSVAEPSGVVTSTTPVEPDPTMAVMLVDDVLHPVDGAVEGRKVFDPLLHVNCSHAACQSDRAFDAEFGLGQESEQSLWP